MSFFTIQLPNKITQSLSKIKIPGQKEDSSELHITVCYIGKNLKIEEACKILEIADQVLYKFEPFTIEAENLTHFPSHNNDPYPIILEVKSKELHRLNEKLCQELDKNKINRDKTHKNYKPHITLAYSEEKPKDRKIEKVEFEVSEVMFFAGDKDKDRFCITFPLQTTKNAELINKTELFSWATNGL